MTSWRAPTETSDWAEALVGMQNSKCRMQTANTAHGRSIRRSSCRACWPDKHRHQALPCSRRPALFGADLDVEIEQIHEPTYCRGVELAQRLLASVADFAKNRPTDIYGTAAFPPFHDRAAATVSG